MEERRRLPKNVRQVGERDELYRVYLEDYVGTYLEKCMSRQGELTIGVLVGESCVIDGNACLFINGALEVNHVWSDEDQLLFSEYSWERMLDAKSRHFGSGEICGSFVCAGEEIIPDLTVLQKLQNRYFPETGSVMLVHSREDSAVYYQNMAGMGRLAGYYIYYERNEAMQSFLVENSQGRVVERAGDEVVVNQFREKMSEKKNMRAPAGLRFAYGLCVCLALAVCAIGINSLGSSQKLTQMEQLLTGILENNQEVGATVSETDTAGGKLTIYDVGDDNDVDASQTEGTMGESAETGQSSPAPTDESVGAEGGTSGESGSETAGVTQADPSETNPAQGEGGDTSESSPAEGETGEANADMPPQEIPGEEVQETPSQGEDAPQPSADVSAQPEETPVSAIPEGYMVYTVHAGETLSSICIGLYGSHDQMAEICDINGLEDANLISAGQQLIVPALADAPQEQEAME